MNARQAMTCAALAAAVCGCGTRTEYVAPRPSAQPPARHEACWTREPIRIDGRMEESVWKQCTPILLNALERRGQSNTDVRIAWGREAMYLFFTCADPDVWGTLSEHDGKLWEEEVVEAFIDADNDGLDYVEIEVSPRNVTFDAWITRFPPTREEIPIFARYEAVGMRTAVVVHGTLEDRSDRDEGWDCEIAIPWSAFEETGGRPPKAGSAWSGNFFRCDLSHGQGEYQAWIPVRGSFHQPDRFGNIVFSGGN